MTKISGHKVWVDESNLHNTRPQSITVQLYADGVLLDVKPIWSDTDSDIWSYTFDNLPQVTEQGVTINYTVRETAVEGYETSVAGTTITNKLIPEEPQEFIELAGTKTWIDNENADGTRPSSITVRLLRDGVEIDSRTVTAEDGWKYSFGKLPVDDGYGNVYTYTIREDGVPRYFPRVDGMNLTNTLLAPDNPKNPENPDNPRDVDTPEAEVPSRKTPSPRPQFEVFTEEEFVDIVSILDYGTPLWGSLLDTGDETPVWPYAFGGIGLAALAALLLLGHKRRRTDKA